MHAHANNSLITTKDANRLLRGWYYHNHEHYVSMILKRMVNNGTLKHLKRGLYMLNKTATKPQPHNPAQMELPLL